MVFHRTGRRPTSHRVRSRWICGRLPKRDFKMGTNLGRLIGDYRGLVETCRERAEELEISRSEIDRLGGLPSGYAGKLLGREGVKRKKRMWPGSLEAMLGVLGLKILVI